MTRTAIYSLQDNALTEQPAIEKPKKPRRKDYDLTGSMISAAMLKYETELAAYNGHISQLRTIPCHESARSLWKDGQKVEEGKDYEVRPDLVLPTHLHDVPTTQQIAFPLPVKSEDDGQLKEDIDSALSFSVNRDCREDAVSAVVKMLLEKYSLTKR